jgi:type IV pilus assembly protein PilX
MTAMQPVSLSAPAAIFSRATMARRAPRHRANQRGVALFVVIVFVLLTMLAALWASRTALFGEMIVGNDADYQRAFEAAQALLQDAELDIREEHADGTPWRQSDAARTLNAPCEANSDICRTKADLPRPPETAEDLGDLLAHLKTQSTGCQHGLCLKRTGNQDFWNDTATLTAMTAANVGARYGQYTGAKKGDSSNPANPILQQTGAGKGGWYWIEVLPYDQSSKSSGVIVGGSGSTNLDLLALNLKPHVVYRITALAQGLKPNSRVVLQQTYARQITKD